MTIKLFLSIWTVLLSRQFICQQVPSTLTQMYRKEFLQALGSPSASPLKIEREPNSHEVSVCRGHMRSITCPNLELLHIYNAFYGKLSGHDCEVPITQFRDQMPTCFSKDAPEIIRQSCQGQQSCDLYAEDSLYSNPCPSVKKYLFVSFTCQGRSRLPEILKLFRQQQAQRRQYLITQQMILKKQQQDREQLMRRQLMQNQHNQQQQQHVEQQQRQLQQNMMLRNSTPQFVLAPKKNLQAPGLIREIVPQPPAAYYPYQLSILQARNQAMAASQNKYPSQLPNPYAMRGNMPYMHPNNINYGAQRQVKYIPPVNTVKYASLPPFQYPSMHSAQYPSVQTQKYSNLPHGQYSDGHTAQYPNLPPATLADINAAKYSNIPPPAYQNMQAAAAAYANALASKYPNMQAEKYSKMEPSKHASLLNNHLPNAQPERTLEMPSVKHQNIQPGNFMATQQEPSAKYANMQPENYLRSEPMKYPNTEPEKYPNAQPVNYQGAEMGKYATEQTAKYPMVQPNAAAEPSAREGLMPQPPLTEGLAQQAQQYAMQVTNQMQGAADGLQGKPAIRYYQDQVSSALNSLYNLYTNKKCDQCDGNCRNYLCYGCGGCRSPPADQQTYYYPYQRQDADTRSKQIKAYAKQEEYHDAFDNNAMALSGLVLYPFPKRMKHLVKSNKKRQKIAEKKDERVKKSGIARLQRRSSLAKKIAKRLGRHRRSIDMPVWEIMYEIT